MNITLPNGAILNLTEDTCKFALGMMGGAGLTIQFFFRLLAFVGGLIIMAYAVKRFFDLLSQRRAEDCMCPDCQKQRLRGRK